MKSLTHLPSNTLKISFPRCECVVCVQDFDLFHNVDDDGVSVNHHMRSMGAFKQGGSLTAPVAVVLRWRADRVTSCVADSR